MKAAHVLAFAALLAVGCDDGCADSAVVVRSTATLDGTVNRGGVVAVADDDMEIGRNNSGIGTRGFISFDLSQLPAGEHQYLFRAELELYEVNVNLLPFQTLGTASIAIVDYGDALDAADFDTPELTDARPLATASKFHNFHTIDLADDVASFLTANPDATRLQFRIQFATDTDTTDPTEYNHHVDLATGNVAMVEQQPSLTLNWSNPAAQ